MKSASMTLGPRSTITIVTLIFSLMQYVDSSAQSNYTPGDNYVEDYHAFVSAPLFWDALSGEGEYFDHVVQDLGFTCGQRYIGNSDYLELWEPDPCPAFCTVEYFRDIIERSTDLIGTLLITSHGSWRHIAVEVFGNDEYGRTARDNAYNTYISQDYDSTEIEGCITPTGHHAICVTEQFLHRYGDLSQALVFVGCCEGSYLIDDFVDSANARVALGISDEFYPSEIRLMVETFFLRMDGKAGRENRTVANARSGLTFVDAYGAENTTLSPAVITVVSPYPLKIRDTIVVRFDTKCDTYATPYILCDWGYVCSETWMDDSVSLKAVFCELPPSGVDEIELTLTWDHVWSARNWACLDGNTNPPGGNNAEGPSLDDYVWTMPVAPCDCTVWGDVTGDGAINPVDVVFMVNHLYHGNDMRVQYENCPNEAGDVNCDGAVNPPDLVLYVNKVYLGNDMFCPDPCS